MAVDNNGGGDGDSSNNGCIGGGGDVGIDGSAVVAVRMVATEGVTGPFRFGMEEVHLCKSGVEEGCFVTISQEK